ncbi:MAG: glycosyltransferase, partial [Candidatus Krumholzibacteria bacterium]|nr:glycosyltransferase [Candidatus Krumholzibacteria bacterium]
MMPEEKPLCVHLIHSLDIGGAQKILYHYAKFHDRNRYRMEAISFMPGGSLIEEIESLGVKVHILNTRSSDIRSLTRMTRIFRENGAKIVHFHNPLPLFLGLPAAFLAGVPVKVMTEHSIDYPQRAGGKPGRIFYPSIRRRLDMVIACSEEVRKSHIPLLDQDKTITILNGIDTGATLEQTFGTPTNIDSETAGPETAGPNPNGSTLRIGSVGTLSAPKGFEYLIEAVRILSARDIPVHLTLVGDGPLRSSLERQASEAGIKRFVEFTGTIGDIGPLLGSFDIVAGSSLREGLPLAILEAMAAGRPIVTTDVGGNREAVENGITGLLVDAGDPKALADAIEDLWHDREQRALMGNAGR